MTIPALGFAIVLIIAGFYLASMLGTYRLAGQSGDEPTGGAHSTPVYHGLFGAWAVGLCLLGAFLVRGLWFSDLNLQRSVALLLFASLVGGAIAFALIGPKFRSRDHVERFLRIALWLCSGVAVVTTFGIVFALVYESFLFFEQVPLFDFLTGTQWSPQSALRSDQIAQSGAFGAIPIFAGTFLIMAIAIVIAVPVGLMIAIYLSQYASRTVRTLVKPVIEILAGIPTIVYGFFALLTIGPIIQDMAFNLGFSVPAQTAFAAGSVMGLMIIPFVSSLSDDIISAVPSSLRDGSYALGATRYETITSVLLPAALPGISGAVLLALSRAIGETMIVVLAAGGAAQLTGNPFEAVTTVTVQIVSLLTGDQAFDSTKTLAAFALGLVLFVITLVLNVIALLIVRRYQLRYD